MGAWRVDSHYGQGAASLRIGGFPYRQPPEPRFFDELARVRAELHAEGHRLRRTFAVLPAVLLVAVVLTTFIATVMGDHADDTGVVVATFRTEPPAPVVTPEPMPPPEPVLAELEPKPEPVLAKPPPRPEPVVMKREPRLAEAPKPPPPPAPKPAARPKPVPVMPKPAPMLAAEPAPAERSRRRAPEMPVPAAPAPHVEVAQLDLSTPTRTAAATRVARERPTPSTAETARPNLAPVANVAPGLPSQTAAPVRTSRAPQFAATQDRGPVPSAAPAMAGLAPPTSGGSEPVRSSRHVPTPGVADARARPNVRVAAAATSAPLPSQSAAAPARTGRHPVAPEPSGRATPTPSVASLSAPMPTASTGGTARSAPARSGAAPPPSSGRSSARSSGEGLAGVPLAALAACQSDRMEDSLKQRVIAAVTTQEECVSRAGTYRFIETRNLNSFLMQVEQAPGRAVGDRCMELQLALECVAGR